MAFRHFHTRSLGPLTALQTVDTAPDDDDEAVCVGVIPTPEPSEEQVVIVKAVVAGRHVIVDAVAGSGKTTTVKHISDACSDRQILVLLYNKTLADETKRRIGNSNVTIYTIHAACAKFYGQNCQNDSGLQAILANSNVYTGSSYQMIIVDEMQDMTPLYAKVIRKIIKDASVKQMVVLGDYMQAIYGYNDAYPEFLTQCQSVFGDLFANPDKQDAVSSKTVFANPDKQDQLAEGAVSDDNSMGQPIGWLKLSLSISYRLTMEVATFINVCVLKANRINAVKHGPNPTYVVMDTFNSGAYINSVIDSFLQQGYKESDIAILAPSVKSTNDPLARACNYLSQVGKKIYKPDDDYRDLNSSVMEGKIVVSTIHKFKGRERKNIILYKFDSSYYMGKDNESQTTCPNVLYVATTRALENLIVLHHQKNDPLPFLDISMLPFCVNMLGQLPKKTNTIKPSTKRTFAVTDLCKHLPSRIMFDVQKHWTVIQETNPGQLIPLESMVQFGKYIENVSSVYGVLVPAIKVFMVTGRYQLTQNLLLFDWDKIIPNVGNRIHEIYNKANLGYDDLGFVANVHNCFTDGFYHPIRQIENYNWISQNWEGISKCVGNLDFVDANGKHEVFISHHITTSSFEAEIRGFIDYLSGPTMWEFKVTTELTIEHELQAIIYASMACISSGFPQMDIYLFNIRSGEKRKLSITLENAQMVIDKVVKCKMLSKQAFEWDLTLKDILT